MLYTCASYELELTKTVLQPAFLSLLLTTLAATPLLTATLVLFGAPVTTHHLHTLLCGAHIALLSTLPLVYVHGVTGETWRQAVALLLPIDEVYGALLGTVLGAWLGAVPIPLDWLVHPDLLMSPHSVSSRAMALSQLGTRMCANAK